MDTNTDLSKSLRYSWFAGEIREAIFSGYFEHGDRLPVESELAKDYGVGRSTVREALRVLLAEGLIITTRGMNGGTFVIRPDLKNVEERLESSLRLLNIVEDISVEHLLQTRAALEIPSVRSATSQHTEEQLELLRAAIPPLSQAGKVGREFSTSRDFHTLILDIAGNPLISATAAPLFAVSHHRFLRSKAPLAFWKGVANDHRRITDAIASEDPDRAADEMMIHLSKLCDSYTLMDMKAKVERSP